MNASERPIGHGTIAQVDGGMWQPSCVCRWKGQRYHEEHHAYIDAARHVANCGLCVLLGRDYMDRCSCANCSRRRIFRRQPSTTG